MALWYAKLYQSSRFSVIKFHSTSNQLIIGVVEPTVHLIHNLTWSVYTNKLNWRIYLKVRFEIDRVAGPAQHPHGHSQFILSNLFLVSKPEQTERARSLGEPINFSNGPV